MEIKKEVPENFEHCKGFGKPNAKEVIIENV